MVIAIVEGMDNKDRQTAAVVERGCYVVLRTGLGYYDAARLALELRASWVTWANGYAVIRYRDR